MNIFKEIKKDKFIGGDRHKEYTEFYKKYYGFMINRASFKLNGKIHTAQDVVQLCMIEISKERVFNILTKVDEKVQRSYIMRMVDNCVVDFYRREKKYDLQTTRELKHFEDKSDYLKKYVLKLELLDMIDNVKSLNTLDRRMLKYMSLYDVKMVELAKLYSTTIKGIRKRIDEVRELLDNDDEFVLQG